MYSLEECERLWAEAGQHGAPEERIERAKAWLPYYAYLAEPTKTMPARQPEDEDGFPLREPRHPRMRFRILLPCCAPPLSLLRACRENS